MACVDLPLPTLPTLPVPLTLGVSLSLSLPPLGLDFCCKILALPSVSIPIPLPTLVLNPAFIATLNGFIASMNSYHDAITFSCPFE